MLGVNVDGIESLIKRENLYLNSYNGNSTRLLSVLSELQRCYSGSDLDFLFADLIDENEEFKTIEDVLNSYPKALDDVKKSYEAEDINLKIQVQQVDFN